MVNLLFESVHLSLLLLTLAFDVAQLFLEGIVLLDQQMDCGLQPALPLHVVTNVGIAHGQQADFQPFYFPLHGAKASLFNYI